MAEIPLTMPKMSMTMEEGTIVEWTVVEGDTIRKGDVVGSVMTDKVEMEVECPYEGTIARLLAPVGAVVAVGDPIALISSEEDDLLGDLFSPPGGAGTAEAETGPGEPERADEQAGTGPPPGSSRPDTPPSPSPGTAPGSPETSVRAVPLARRLAREAGIDLHSIPGTGPHKTIRARDVRARIDEQQRAGDAAAEVTASAPVEPARPAPATPDERILGDARTRATRAATAKAMAQSTTVPQFTVYRTLELTATARARTGVLRGISWTTLLLRAYAMMLRELPDLNGTWTERGVRANEQVAVTLAVDTPVGLMAPVILEADQLPVRELDERVRQLAAQAKEGAIPPESVRPGTATLSNLGGLGVDRFNALITYPQATALSTGVVGFRPVVAPDATISAVLSCEVGLTVDHRVADGADAARGLQAVQDLLADPLRLAL